MMRRAGPLVGLVAVVSFLLGLVVAGTRPPIPAAPAGAPPGDPGPRVLLAPAAVPETRLAGAGMVDFASVIARVNAAVVSVDTASRSPEDRSRFSSRRSLAGDDQGSRREGSGSGFIIDPSGFILTNHHVVSGADRVTVTLADRRAFRADVIGVDPAIDVALLRIHAPDRLPVAPLGDSAGLRVGEWVCAIGNPLGVYVHSVTVGVVSYLGRKLFDEGLDAFIQTDAAISFGNSGGPLVNAQGQVVGITTAVSAQVSNIGFAVPISQVVSVLPDLREHGSIARGFLLGLRVTAITPALRNALRIGPERGALVQDVEVDTPAEDAGVRLYDVITAADGHAIESDEELARYAASRPPGTLTLLSLWRDGATRSVSVKLRDRPLATEIRNRVTANVDARVAAQPVSPLGLQVRPLESAVAQRLRLPDTLQGVLVSEVDPAGPALLAQVRLHQVILEINRRRVASVAEYRSVVAGLRPGDPAALLLYDRVTQQRVLRIIVPDADR